MPEGIIFAPTGSSYDPDTICFVGRMDYYPNQECMIDFCANALPILGIMVSAILYSKGSS